MPLIAKETAVGIAFAYREIETAEKLLQHIAEALEKQCEPDLRDAFGRQRGLQLGVPSGDNCHRLFDLPWSLARPVIEAHIAEQYVKLAELNQQAIDETQEG